VIAPAARSRALAIALVAPAVLFVAAAFLYPLLNLGRLSFDETVDGGVLVETWSLASYRELISDAFYAELTLNSLLMSIEASTAAALIGYPVALCLYRTTSRWRGLLMVLAVAPLLVSGVVRVFGWLVILGDRGLINALLGGIGLTQSPVRMVYNWTGVIVGLTEGLLPFVVMAQLAGFGRLDRTLEDAADTLGAPPWRRFLKITLPLSLPGLLLGWMIGFIISMSAFISPRLLGGGRVFVLATEIYGLAFELNNWPLASALALYMLAILVLFTLVFRSLTARLTR
jgi:putative spermidine/putrescine transport system permease protein